MHILSRERVDGLTGIWCLLLTRAPTGVWAKFAPTGGGVRISAPLVISKTMRPSENSKKR